eukprot:3352063-Alexandrium_andersonii.AAC.1
MPARATQEDPCRRPCPGGGCRRRRVAKPCSPTSRQMATRPCPSSATKRPNQRFPTVRFPETLQ